MEQKALAALMVRIIGLWELVTALNAVPTAIAPFFNPGYVERWGIGLVVVAGLLGVGIPLVFGVLLVRFPDSVVMRVLRVEGIEPSDASDATMLERVIIAMIGLWLTIQAVLDVVQIYTKWRLYMRVIAEQYPAARPPGIGSDEFSGFVVAGLQFALGLWLLLGAHGIANVLARLRGRTA